MSEKILPDDLATKVGAAALPPVAAEAGERLAAAISVRGVSRVGSSTTSAAPKSDDGDVVAARDKLATAYLHVAEWLGSAAHRPYELSLVVAAATTLAEAHRLDRDEAPDRLPCKAALEVVRALLREFRAPLRRRARRLLEDVIDGIAIEHKKRDRFVRSVRGLLAAAERWQPTRLDVGPDSALTFGGVRARYRTTGRLPGGEPYIDWTSLTLSNAEGRLVVLVATGRSPLDVPGPTFSRAAAAVRAATRGAVELKRRPDGRPVLEPAVELTRRAEQAAATVKSLHVRPRRRRKKLQDAR